MQLKKNLLVCLEISDHVCPATTACDDCQRQARKKKTIWIFEKVYCIPFVQAAIKTIIPVSFSQVLAVSGTQTLLSVHDTIPYTSWVTLAQKSRPSLPASYGYSAWTRYIISLNDMSQSAYLIKSALQLNFSSNMSLVSRAVLYVYNKTLLMKNSFLFPGLHPPQYCICVPAGAHMDVKYISAHYLLFIYTCSQPKW